MPAPAPKTNDFLELAGQLAVEFLVLSLLDLDLLKPLRITQNIRYEVSANEVKVYMPFYYRFIESGRRPGVKRVPVSALMDWIQRKNVPVPQGMTRQGFAYAIQTNIYKNGIKARPFVADAIDMATDELSIRIFGEIDEYIKSSVRLFTQIPTGRNG